MTPFEFVFGLMSIMTSLGLAHVVAGAITLLRHEGGVRFSWLTAAWMWSAFALTVANWGSYWPLREVKHFGAGLVLASVAVVIGQYAFCAMVTPVPTHGELTDLKAFHDRQHRRYATALLVLCGLSIVTNAIIGTTNAYPEWVRDSVLTVVAGGFALAAILLRSRRGQAVAASAIAVLLTWFMFVSCTIVAT